MNSPKYIHYYQTGKNLSLLSPSLHYPNGKEIEKDQYPNRGFTPTGWEHKLLSVSHLQKLPISYEYIEEAFGPNSSISACKILHEKKLKYCEKTLDDKRKQEENKKIKLLNANLDNDNKIKYHTSKLSSCTKEMTDHELKQHHDNIMKCRNIRALESYSYCTNKNNEWMNPDDPGHAEQTNNKATSAASCVNMFSSRNRHSKLPKLSPNGSVRRRSKQKHFTVRRKSKK